MTDKQFLVYLMAKRARLIQARLEIIRLLPSELSVKQYLTSITFDVVVEWPVLDALDVVISELTDEIEALKVV